MAEATGVVAEVAADGVAEVAVTVGVADDSAGLV